MKKIISAVAVMLFSAALFGTAFAAPGHSGDGGNNGNHGGSGGGGNAGGGQGGGDGGNGGGSHGGGNSGGGNGGGEGSNGGGSTGGGSTSGGASVSSGDAGSTSGGGEGAYIITGGGGISKADRFKLMDAVKRCEMTRPGLALGDTNVNGGWSFRTADDTVWRFVQMCMADEGYPAYGPDYRNSESNFGQR